MSSTRRRALLVVGPAASLRRAAPVLDAHAAVRPVRTVTARRGATAWRRRLDDVAAVIVIADPAVPVADVVGGTHVVDGGREVPVGVLPDDPRAYDAVAAVQRRRPPRVAGPIALLSSREDHVRARALRLAAALDRARVPVRSLPSGRVDRGQLLPALASGPGLVIYTGEGDARGWRGYGRVQSWEFDRAGAVPMGAVVSLSCRGAGRLGSLHGLTETLVERGLAAGALGAVTDVRRDDDEALGIIFAARLAAGAASLADLLTPRPAQLAPFRISGDPLAPLTGADGSQTALERISAPAVGDVLAAATW